MVRRAVVVLVAGLAMVAGWLVSASPAEAASPDLTLERTRANVTFTRYESDDYNWTEGSLGVYAVSGKRPFKVTAKRSSYKKPIVAKLVRPGKDKKLPTPSDFTGLAKFYTTTFTNSAGKVVAKTTSSFCPNSENPVRRRASAPATSPFPSDCNSWNPYTLGAVWGIQQGYAAPLGNTGLEDLPSGKYTATVTIAPAYRKALGLSKSQATAKVKVTVEVEQFDECDEDPDACMAQLRGKANGNSDQTVAATRQPTKLTGQRAKKPSGPLPDLRSLPAWDIQVEDGRYLNFSATVWNAGPGPMVVDGFRSKKNPNLMKAYQYFFTKSGKQKGYAPVGGMEWDARDGHDHWHFQDFASYQLVDSKKKFVALSSKEAFCLANTDAVNYLVKGANWKPTNTDLHTSCGTRESIGVREVLDSGSGDTYVQSLPGQSFDLKGLRNGTYFIKIKANPDKRLYERKTSNNTSYRKVVIGGREGARTVKVAKVGIIKEMPSFYGAERDHGMR
ncbi:MAG: lysyl oxidase family protein [Microlunatus sp.]